jgi:Cu-processing system permease protein
MTGVMSPAAGIWAVAKPQIKNVVRSRWLIAYAVFCFAATEVLLRFTGGDAKTLLSLTNVVLFLGPMVTMVYGTVYLYSSREFIELLLAQPLKRSTLFGGLYVGLAAPLTAAFIAGIAAPFLLHGLSGDARAPLAIMLGGGSVLTLIFTGLAFCVALRFEDRLTGLGMGMALWLLLALAYDGLILFIVAIMPDRAVEKSLLAVSLANPVDLVRIAVLFQFDISALMGYTGAVFSRFFSGATGVAVIAAALTTWVGVPLMLGFSQFKRKDF